MRIIHDVRVTLTADPQTHATLAEILEGLGLVMGALTKLPPIMETMMSRVSDEIQELATQAAQASEGIAAVKTLVEGLLQQIEDNADDEAALQEIVATGRANLDALAQVGQPGTQEPPVIEEPTEPTGEDTTGDAA